MDAPPRRTSIFQEHFDIELTALDATEANIQTPRRRVSKQDDVYVEKQHSYNNALPTIGEVPRHRRKKSRLEHSRATPTPTLTPAQTQSPLPVRNPSNMMRLGVFAFLLVALLPLLHSTSFFGYASFLQPVRGSVIPPRRNDAPTLDRRADSPTDVCFRWAQQSAVNNGTLYLYGGQATTSSTQDSNAWNNNFLSLDLTKTWQIASPALTGLPQPSGPPNVSLGYLWNSRSSLFLYGGQFSWKPAVSPTAYSTWEYAIADDTWIEHRQPVTSKGTSAPSAGTAVQRAAEGAGVNVPSLGRGFYFGGHLDGYTTEGWSQSVPRLYLRSLLEFTFPGVTNDQVESLSNNGVAGSNGVYRNVTDGGQQADVGFTQRADGLLIYVPGFGDQGILLAIAGGTNESFTQMNQLDVYDIATSSWYIQSTSGPTPEIRVNPCAVMAAAPDGTSYNIYMFGGQNLIPAGNQTQFNDMWILTLPSFTWIPVDMDGQSVPYGRSGHTCNVWDAQMVMVGGYVGAGTLTCERPGIYVFDLSALEWVNQFTALSSTSMDNDSNNKNTDTNTKANEENNSESNPPNPFNQQPAQISSSSSSPGGGLEGSFGYKVPQAIIAIIGGDSTGKATLTTPINIATAGPLATGKPLTYTADAADATATPGDSSNDSSSDDDSNSSGKPNLAAIIAGILAFLFFILASYLAFCAYVYRKQLQLYKRHVELTSAQAQARGGGEKFVTTSRNGNGKYHHQHSSSSAATTTTTTTTGGGGDSRGRESYGSGRGVESGYSNPNQYNTNNNNKALRGGVGVGGGGGGAYYKSLRDGGDGDEDRDGDEEEEEDLLNSYEPSFVGVILNPRRSLRVINRD